MSKLLRFERRSQPELLVHTTLASMGYAYPIGVPDKYKNNVELETGWLQIESVLFKQHYLSKYFRL